jgi:hypothetical protein
MVGFGGGGAKCRSNQQGIPNMSLKKLPSNKTRRTNSKQARVLAMLHSKQGATCLCPAKVRGRHRKMVAKTSTRMIGYEQPFWPALKPETIGNPWEYADSRDGRAERFD